MSVGVPASHVMSQNQERAIRAAKAQQNNENHSSTTIEAQDSGPDPKYVIYVYNCLDRAHVVSQPPLFPGVIIPACKPGEKVSFTKLPAFVKEPYCKVGSTEMYYKNVDGRKAATSLLNPSAYPGTAWESQLQVWKTEDQYGNNLNALGVWWSLTKPDETEKLDKELKLFKDRATRTMNEMVSQAESYHANGDLKFITPMMHFAMDYLGKQASWHMPHYHMITCPNCGAVVKEGIAYHKNDFGEKCIVDVERYKAMLDRQKALEAPDDVEGETETVPAEPRKGKKRLG